MNNVIFCYVGTLWLRCEFYIVSLSESLLWNNSVQLYDKIYALNFERKKHILVLPKKSWLLVEDELKVILFETSSFSRANKEFSLFIFSFITYATGLRPLPVMTSRT